MNAALISDLIIPSGRDRRSSGAWSNEEIVIAGWLRIQNSPNKRGAFRCWRWIAGCLIQSVNKAAAKFLHLRKGVSFTTHILQRQSDGAVI